MTIAEWLKKPSRGSAINFQLRKLLADPSCWPKEAELAHLATTVRATPPAPAPVGTTLIVSVSQPRGDRSTLYRLRPDRIEGALPWGPLAASTASRIWESVTRDLPVVVDFAALERMPTWSADHLIRDGAEHTSDRDLDGDSYGAAFLLASASLLMQTGVPTDFIALACVGEDGRTGPVGMLERKLDCVLEWAPGIARIAVDDTQRVEANAVIARRGSNIRVEPVRDAKDLFALAFPTAGDALPAPLVSDSSARKKLQDRIFIRVVQPKLQVTDWSCVSRTVTALMKMVESNDIATEKLTFIRSIADRHDGKPGPFILASDVMLQSVPATLRPACVAQSIQALTDGGPFDESGRSRLARYEAMLDAAETAEHLVWRGALGRAWAAQRQYDRARVVLEQAVQGWTDLDDAENRSRALCELVRVQGVAGDGSGVERSAQLIMSSLHEVSSSSRCYQLLALGRALVLVHRHDAALQVFSRSDVSWTSMAPHVSDARTRWMASAAIGSGDRKRGTDLRASLDREDADAANRLLAQLDAALDGATDQALESLLERFMAMRRQASEPLLRVEGTAVERARILAREYPY